MGYYGGTTHPPKNTLSTTTKNKNKKNAQHFLFSNHRLLNTIQKQTHKHKAKTHNAKRHVRIIGFLFENKKQKAKHKDNKNANTKNNTHSTTNKNRTRNKNINTTTPTQARNDEIMINLCCFRVTTFSFSVFVFFIVGFLGWGWGGRER